MDQISNLITSSNIDTTVENINDLKILTSERENMEDNIFQTKPPRKFFSW